MASDARAALRWLTAGGGLETISLLRLEEFLWYVLPSSWPLPRTGSSRSPGRSGGCSSWRAWTGTGTPAPARRPSRSSPPTTAPAPKAPRLTRHGGGLACHAARYRPARLGIGPGAGGAVGLRGVRRRVEIAIAARDIRVGRQRLEDQAGRARRTLADPVHGRARHDTWLSRISAERIEEWTHGHPGERARMAKRIVPRLLEPPELPGEPLPTLRWLLQHADAGLPLTSRHYIAPSLVAEAAGLVRLGRAPGGKRRQELSVFPLHTLRGLAQREMGALRRSGTHPGADQDRAADGRRRGSPVAHRHRRAARPGRRAGARLRGGRAGGDPADHHAERQRGGL